MILKFFRIGSQPVTLVYPIPLVSFLGFCLSGLVEGFVTSFLFVLFFATAINLWNHLNDAEDDDRAGRYYSKFLIEKRSEAVLFVIFCYIISFFILYIFSKNRWVAIPFFFVSAIFTWIYSDRLFIGKFIKRFKEDYRTEILTYLFSTTTFFMLFWTFFSEVSATGIYFTAVNSTIYLSAFFLKDIKDISADSEAGYRTLAVVLPPSYLLKISATFFVLTLIIITAASLSGVFSKYSILTLFILPLLFYTFIHFYRNEWRISPKIAGKLKIYVYCYPLSILLLSLFSLIR